MPIHWSTAPFLAGALAHDHLVMRFLPWLANPIMNVIGRGPAWLIVPLASLYLLVLLPLGLFVYPFTGDSAPMTKPPMLSTWQFVGLAIFLIGVTIAIIYLLGGHSASQPHDPMRLQ